VSTYRPKGNGCGGQTYQASVARMWLVDRISIVIAELVQHGFDLSIFFCSDELTDDTL